MNTQIQEILKRGCKQKRDFFITSLEGMVNPFDACEKKCYMGYACRQLLKPLAPSSWFSSQGEIKNRLEPGKAVYAQQVEDGFILTTPPFKKNGHSLTAESGRVLIFRDESTT